MNAFELYKKKDDQFVPSGVFACGQCRVAHRDKKSAERCCKPPVCSCGKPTEMGRAYCDECDKIKFTEREKARFDKAEKLQDWDGPVYIPDHYYDDIESLINDIIESGEERPKYCYVVKEFPIFSFNVIDLIETAVTDSGVEDFDLNDVDGVEPLKKAFEAFEEDNKHHIYYEFDESRVVLISEDDYKKAEKDIK